jgi:diguanylate cyclase (GGDEF)-like protein
MAYFLQRKLAESDLAGVSQGWGYLEVTGANMERLSGVLRRLFVSELEEEDKRYRAYLASGLCRVMILIMILFGLIENAKGDYGAASIRFGSALFFAVSLFLLRRHFNLISNLVVAVTFFLYLTSYLLDIESFHNLFWLPVFPLVSIFVMGRERGVLWTVIFVVVNVLIVSRYYVVEGGFPWDFAYFVNALLASGVIFISALTYENIKVDLEKRLRLRAEIDSLTNIYNRSKFFSLLERELDRYRRYGGLFSLLMLDIDHFKEVNDRYGHLVGDDVLRELAKLVGANIRSTDIFARYGGEEFMVIVPETDAEGAEEMAEKLRRLIADHRFDGVENITVCVGVTEVAPGDTSDDLIARVDEGLYAAKIGGRNRVVTVASKRKGG